MEEENKQETKLVKLDKVEKKRQEYCLEPMEIDGNEQYWMTLSNFTPQQTQDWLNIGLQPTDFNFATWLRDTKHLTPEQVLNQGNYQALSQEFFTEWQQIEIPPK